MDYIMLAWGSLLTVGTAPSSRAQFALVNLDRAELEARQAR